MKFTDGYWKMKDGVEATYPFEYHSARTESGSLTIFAATKKQRNRGDTLNSPLITVNFSSPIDNVIRVRAFHHKGFEKQGPEFILQQAENHNISIKENDNEWIFSSGQLLAAIAKSEPWQIEYRDENGTITKSGNRALAYMKSELGEYFLEQLDISVGECVYGLGERFTSFVKNGQSIDIWNKDGGTSSEQAYKNIPFYLTNKGYGVFVNHPERVSFEIGSEKVQRVQFSVSGEYLDYFLIYGPTPKEILERYTQLTGRPPLLPPWSFGLWLSTSFTTNYDEKTVSKYVDEMADRDIPLHVLHYDCFWMKEYHWCDFEWNQDQFPDPKGMLSRMKEKGVHICVWINSYISQQSKLFEEAVENGYLIKKPNGDVWQTDEWQAGMGIIDFTNPHAVSWFQEKLDALIDLGVDCFKADFGERIPTNVQYYDGSDPQKMHNYYTFLYNKAVYDVLSRRLGDNHAVLFSRSATAGSQQFPVHWGGDCTASYESMAETLRGGLSLGMCGFGYWSHDISGFEKTATPDLYKRWIQFGLLSSHSRLHGNESLRVPWVFDEESVDVLRYFTKLKCQMMPYIFKMAKQASELGIPILRPMVMEFPHDPACDYLDRQYMFGEDVLVAPIFNSQGHVEYYLPQGNWTNIITGDMVTGGRWVKEEHDYFSLPILARPNSIIPFGNNSYRVDYDFEDDTTFHIFQLEGKISISCTIINPDGTKGLILNVNKVDNQIIVHPENATKTWKILLRNFYSIKNIVGGELLNTNELGVSFKPQNISSPIKIIF